MIREFFIRKATSTRIHSILKKEGFIYTQTDVEDLLLGNQKGTRYGNKVLVRKEDGVEKKRFIKIVLDGTRKTCSLFKRQVRITSALHEDKDYTFPTTAVIKDAAVATVPYAIFETRDEGKDFGFMHDSLEFYEQFTKSEMNKLVEVIYAFHKSGLNIQKSSLRLARDITSTHKSYEKDFDKWFKKRINHKDKEGRELTKSIEELLILYTGITDVRLRTISILKKLFTQAESSRNKKYKYLVHADMQIDNIYKHKSGEFELLDFEWVGATDNPVIAIMYDYGNLRARAWSSPSFQKMLDESMLEVGPKIYPNSTEMLKAGLSLGALRSSLQMSQYHLDFDNTVRKDKCSETDYHNMYTKTVGSLIKCF